MDLYYNISPRFIWDDNQFDLVKAFNVVCAVDHPSHTPRLKPLHVSGRLHHDHDNDDDHVEADDDEGGGEWQDQISSDIDETAFLASVQRVKIVEPGWTFIFLSWTSQQ